MQTITVTQNFISCRLAKHFESPEKFIPERWLKNSDRTSKVQTNPYLVLPFGHGMRSCIARRFAEQNMLVLMLRVRRQCWRRSHHWINSLIFFLCQFQIIRKFEIGWAGVDYLDVKTTTTINKPEYPVQITFKERNKWDALRDKKMFHNKRKNNKSTQGITYNESAITLKFIWNQFRINYF